MTAKIIDITPKLRERAAINAFFSAQSYRHWSHICPSQGLVTMMRGQDCPVCKTKSKETL